MTKQDAFEIEIWDQDGGEALDEWYSGNIYFDQNEAMGYAEEAAGKYPPPDYTVTLYRAEYRGPDKDAIRKNKIWSSVEDSGTSAKEAKLPELPVFGKDRWKSRTISLLGDIYHNLDTGDNYLAKYMAAPGDDKNIAKAARYLRKVLEAAMDDLESQIK